MNEQNLDRRALIAGLGGLAAGAALFSKSARAGDLNPPAGPIGPTGHTLSQIRDRIARTDAGVAEPRIPIQSLAGNETVLHVVREPGSYYLTGDIVGEPGRGGILVESDNVTIDLCGHSLRSDVESLIAIDITGDQVRDQIHILNGSVRGWQTGIAGRACRASSLRNMTLRFVGWAAGGGGNTELGSDSVISDCLFQRCRGPAAVLDRGRIERCIVNDGDPGGFFMVRDGLVVDCEVIGCNGNAFCIQEGGFFARCLARFAGNGFVAVRGAAVLDCVAMNCGTGVVATSNTRIERCHAAYGQIGFDVPAGESLASLVENTAVSNEQVGFRLNGQRNWISSCRAANNGTDYAVEAGNSHGPVIDVRGVGDISGVSGADHPWANFVF